MRPLHCLLWHHSRNQGCHTWTVNNKQNKLHWAYSESKKDFGCQPQQNDCLPCCFLTEGQVLSSSKNRTGKQSPYKLPDPSAHRPVGRFLPPYQLLPPSRTVKRSHLPKRPKYRLDARCIDNERLATARWSRRFDTRRFKVQLVFENQPKKTHTVHALLPFGPI